ncbi:MAG TPA: nitronate monooxygenase [Dehalococcoidia bacterium]|nr:nitronate monooxygenase [Dehalococcoidia bacterium]
MTTASSLHTPVCDLLGIEYPVFGFNHSIDVTVEVSRAGGIGVYGATRRTPEEIRQDLRTIRERLGDRPFGVDLVLPSGMPERNNREDIEAQIPDGHREFVEGIYDKYRVKRDRLPGARSRFVRSNEVAHRQIEAVLESDVDLFACGIGSPPEAIAAAHAKGKKVVSLVGAPKHARRVKDAGVDIIVAQGYDAGAHTGEIGTFSLVPQVVDIAGDTPVLAAGGVATGRHVAAALAMGAQGVWIGTAWLFTKENHTDPIILQKLIEAGPEDTVISRADSGKTLRQIRTAWSEEWAQEEAPRPLRMPYQDILVGDLLGAIQRQRVEPLMHSPAGQGVAHFRAETTVAAVMERLLAETQSALTRLRVL